MCSAAMHIGNAPLKFRWGRFGFILDAARLSHRHPAPRLFDYFDPEELPELPEVPVDPDEPADPEDPEEPLMPEVPLEPEV